MNWIIHTPNLRKVLMEHFPEAQAEQINHFAEKIYDESSSARPLQWMERNDNKPSVDIENLRTVSTHLRKAAEKVERLGWHGGESIQDYSRKLYAQSKQINGLPVLSNQDAIKVLTELLQQMSDELAECAKDIDTNAPTVMSAFGSEEPAGKSRGRPAATHARLVVRQVYAVFEEMNGKTPSVTTNPYSHGNPASGPFLELVKDIFEALEIKASPETWARDVCKENNAPKR